MVYQDGCRPWFWTVLHLRRELYVWRNSNKQLGWDIGNNAWAHVNREFLFKLNMRREIIWYLQATMYYFVYYINTIALYRHEKSILLMNNKKRGYYLVVRRYVLYAWVAQAISHKWVQQTGEMLFVLREHDLHIFELTCNFLFII